MSIYSSMQTKESVMQNNKYKINIPSADGWYPFVMTFNPTNFANWSSSDTQMSIMYNFPAFNKTTHASEIFNPNSDKYSSFYGAYALQKPDGYFGFSNSTININEILQAFRYDYMNLVLNDFGCSNTTFDMTEYNVEYNVKYLNEPDWVKIDALIHTNGLSHKYTNNSTSYIQYGKPSENTKSSFDLIDMYGRIYLKVFPEYNSTIMIYVLSPNKITIAECDSQILEHITITDPR